MTGLARLELLLSNMLVLFELSLELFLSSKMEEMHNSGGVPISSEMHLDLNFEDPTSMICMLEADVTPLRQTGLSLDSLELKLVLETLFGSISIRLSPLHFLILDLLLRSRILEGVPRKLLCSFFYEVIPNLLSYSY